MNLYILLDDEAPQEVADKLMTAINAWLEETEIAAQPVDVRDGEGADWLLGIQLEIKRKAGLKRPLEFLYQQAEKMEREFVIGLYDKETGDRENVCYFGYEEGRPDPDEVALYLGLIDEFQFR